MKLSTNRLSFLVGKHAFYLVITLGLTLSLAVQAPAQVQIRVDVTNNAPPGGAYLTPVWVGLHNGSFDSYDGGSASAMELERIAEDGNAAPISDVFAADNTLVATSVIQTGMRAQDTVGGAPIAPGQSVSATLDFAADMTNGYFSYASMVLPSNDYFVANGDPLAHDLSSLFSGTPGANVTFNIGATETVNDAGTEVNDFATSAGNGLFAGLGGGQAGPNEGADQNGVIANVAGMPYDAFLNTPAGFDFGQLNFNDAALYPDGVATVSLTVVPEPSSLVVCGIGLVLLSLAGRRLRHQ